METRVFLERTGVFCLSVVLTVILCTIVVCVAVRINSPGIPKQYIDENGILLPNSISEKGFISVNGSKLGYFIKGKNKQNPILLYLHGEMPDYFLTELYQTGLDELFTVVWLDQRGTGLSYKAQSKDETVTTEELIADTKAVTDYLRQRFLQDKIYLMAHSSGTYLGIKVVQKYPELYKAYIGMAQTTYQKLSEQKAYRYIMEKYKSNPARKKQYNLLEKNPVTISAPIPAVYEKIRDKTMLELGIGFMHDMKNMFTGLFIPSVFFSEYSFAEKINLWLGSFRSGNGLLQQEILVNDLSKEVTAFKMPVYFLHGIYDYMCSYGLAKQYYDIVSAPEKGFYTFEKSAHSPIFEEPELCMEILRKYVLKFPDSEK